MGFKNLKFLMEQVTGNKQYLAIQALPFFAYQDGHRTDKQIGFRYEVVETGNFEKFGVKVFNLSPKLTAEMLEGAHEKVYVRFIDGTATPYISGHGIEYSFTATDIEVVKKTVAPAAGRE